jgi:hypothetical protein
MRQPHQIAHINLRLREDLRRKLERAATKRHFSLTNEIRARLEDSLTTTDAPRTIDDAAADMSVCWARFSARFLRMDLADQLADLVTAKGDPDRIELLARLIIRHRAAEQGAPSWERRS